MTRDLVIVVGESPYSSPRCVLGSHDRCRDAVPRESDVPGVRYLVCACPCHQRSLRPQGEA
ncbi:hypothetical protein DF268_45345 [Streptomyces sp. V2]|nr:hypothetical protein DF268_45345 [Streptomyces sp. V2]